MSNAPATNPHAAYYAAKDRVMAALREAGAFGADHAITEAGFADMFGAELAADAAMVAARGAEVRSTRLGYFLGRVRNNGRA